MKTRNLPAVLVILAALTLTLAPASAQTGMIHGDAKTLIVQLSDLPPIPFPMAGGNPQGVGYAALFFRPEVLSAEKLPDGDLLGVMANVDVHMGLPQAKAIFGADQSAASIGGPSAGAPAKELKSDKLNAKVEGADEVLGFRTEYILQGVHVIDYRYRLRVANTVASLVVSARAGDGGVEPAAFAGQAQSIAERQAARLAGARK